MLKKMLSIVLLAGFLFGFASAETHAATTVQPPAGVGTYVDFYHEVRLQWKPAAGAVAYNVYVADGYNAQTGFVLDHKLSNYALRYINRQYWIVDYVSTPKIQWYTIHVTSVDKDGNESAPCTANVNVTR